VAPADESAGADAFPPPPPDPDLFAFLQRHAPPGPAALCPEVTVFQARSLVEVWEAAERLAAAPLPSPFWAYPWAAGQALARVLLDRPAWVRGGRVLDLGAGGGVSALAAAAAGAAAVVANDVDPWALAVTRLAADLQGADVALLAGDLTGGGAGAMAGWDVVLAGDLCYERRVAGRQRRALQHAADAGALVLVADAGRAFFDPTGLEEVAHFELQVPPDLEGVDERVPRVYRVRPTAAP
jgi:predicted nicotinamide N-methyase